MKGDAKKVAGWMWVGLFYALVLAAGIVLVGGGTVLATFGLGVLRNDASWHLIAAIALMAAGVAAFVGGAVLLFRITHISVPGRDHSENARAGEYVGYTDATITSYGDQGHHHDGGGSGSN